MSAFAIKHRDQPLRPYADPETTALRLGVDSDPDHSIEPAPEYVYNPIIEPGTFAHGTTPPKHIIAALRFNPPEEIVSRILIDLCRPDATLIEVAERANTTLESLTLWMSRPDISARLDAHEAAIARRARLSVLNCIPCMIDASAHILREYHEAESDIHGPATQTVLASCRNRQTAIDAQKLLLRIYKTLAPRPTIPRPLSRSSGGGVASEASDGGGVPPRPHSSSPAAGERMLPGVQRVLEQTPGSDPEVRSTSSRAAAPVPTSQLQPTPVAPTNSP